MYRWKYSRMEFGQMYILWIIYVGLLQYDGYYEVHKQFDTNIEDRRGRSNIV